MLWCLPSGFPNPPFLWLMTWTTKCRQHWGETNYTQRRLQGIPAVCKGVLLILLSVFQASGQTVSKYRRITGSPSRLAMWKLFQPSLFFRSGLAPCSTRTWITSRFFLVQAIIRGVLRSTRMERSWGIWKNPGLQGMYVFGTDGKPKGVWGLGWGAGKRLRLSASDFSEVCGEITRRHWFWMHIHRSRLSERQNLFMSQAEDWYKPQITFKI